MRKHIFKQLIFVIFSIALSVSIHACGTTNKRLAVTIAEHAEQALIKETARIDKIVKEQGYKGYESISLLGMMYKTRRDGGLSDYVNMVVGCPRFIVSNCEYGYHDLDVLQVSEKWVLYGCPEISLNGNGYPHWFAVLIRRKPGVMYQKGQALKSSFFVFKGTHTYKTVTGGSNTVPIFLDVGEYVQ